MGRLQTKVEKLDMDFNLPAPMVRSIAVAGIATLVVTGLIYSRGERPDVAVGPKGVVVTQPKNSDLQKEAEVHSRPVQSDRMSYRRKLVTE